MLNQIILVGRITKINEEDCTVTLRVTRSFKNAEGIYEIDNIKCNLFEEKTKKVKEYCEEGSLIGIRGRVQENNGNLEIVAEKITFLGKNKGSEE